MAMHNVKLVVVGDGAVGKSSLLITYTENRFPADYVPTVFDNFTTGVEVDGHLINFALWDTAGQEEYSRLRALSYPETDVFLICFSSASPPSLDNVKTKWFPEVSHNCKGARVILVCTKTDLRDGPQDIIIPPGRGQAVAKDINAAGYFETSSLRGEGLRAVFEGAIRVALGSDIRTGLSSDLKPKSKKVDKSKPIAPVMPPAGPAPRMYCENNIFGENFKKFLDENKDKGDVVFNFSSGENLCTERCLLVSGSAFFYDLLVRDLPKKDKSRSKTKDKMKSKQQPDKVESKKEVGEIISPPEEAERVDEEIPEQYCCPITADLMKDPVLAEDGHTYERSAIVEWITKNGTSPITREPLSKDVLIVNRIVKSQIQVYKQNHALDKQSEPKITTTETNNALKGLWLKIDKNRHSVIKSISMKKKKILIQIRSKISYKHIYNIVCFILTGLPDLSLGLESQEIITIATAFKCDELVTIYNNIKSGDEELNPSIGTLLNDKLGEKATGLFWKKEFLSDLTITLRSNHAYKVPVHKSFLISQCPYFKQMLNSKFKESSESTITIGGASGSEDEVSKTAMNTVLEYLYSSHCTIEGSDDVVGIMVLANRFGLSRLVSLCELSLSKSVEVAIKDSFENADIDVIGLLLCAQQNNAGQLAKFCLHLISSNYQPFSKRKEFELLEGENLKHIEEHQWPPISYLRDYEQYLKLVGKEKKSDEKCAIS